MNEDMKILREINLEAERFYDKAQALGNHAYQAFKDKRRAQLTGLESIAESSLKTYLEKDLSDRLNVVCSNVGIVTKLEKGKSKQDSEIEKEKLKAHRWKRQDIHLRLIREFIRQMVVQYEYRTGEGGE